MVSSTSKLDFTDAQKGFEGDDAESLYSTPGYKLRAAKPADVEIRFRSETAASGTKGLKIYDAPGETKLDDSYESPEGEDV